MHSMYNLTLSDCERPKLMSFTVKGAGSPKRGELYRRSDRTNRKLHNTNEMS